MIVSDGFPGAFEPTAFVENLFAGSGNDTIRGNGAANLFTGGGGNDTIYGGGDIDTLQGGEGDDILLGEDGDDELKGDAGNDILVGGFGFDTLDGGAGLDTADYTFYNGNTGVNLANGRVAFEANPGQFETLTSIEIVFTGNGDDLLSGSAQSEGLAGTGGRDDIWGYGGNDVLDGGADLDHLYGGTGNDDLDGGTGSDTLWGNEGTDILLGGEDEDFLFGEAGPDRLTVGGADEDWFIYLKASDSRPGTGRDTIYDFNPAENDLIDLSDIDADRSNNPGNDRFKFIGGHKFSGNGGELRYKNGVLQMDIDGHGKIDMQINLANSPALHRDDFSL